MDEQGKPNGEKINLEYPVTVDGKEYRELFMRRPKARDNLAAAKGKGTDAEKEMKLFCNLCEVPPAVIQELDMADYYRVQDAFKGFLPSSRESAEE